MDRFAARLESRQRPFYRKVPYAVRIAAMVCLVAASSILVYEQVRRGEPLKTNRVDIVMEELMDAEFYYTSLISEKYNAIERFTSDDPEQQKMLMEEMEAMDRMFNALREDLQANPGDERIIHAMVSHYEMKLEVMTQILMQLENVKQSTNNQHEKTEI